MSHFTTSTLILGRSGTGKTTCLVFKLLAQFQARSLVSEEEPIRQACIPSTMFATYLTCLVNPQVLLTRSPYLASKLNSYTRSLIKSQVPNSPAGNFLNKNETLSDAADMTIDTKMTLFSPEMRFPLVCTFDQFLTILRNTIKLSWLYIYFMICSNHLAIFAERSAMMTLATPMRTKFSLAFSILMTSKPSIGVDFRKISSNLLLHIWCLQR